MSKHSSEVDTKLSFVGINPVVRRIPIEWNFYDNISVAFSFLIYTFSSQISKRFLRQMAQPFDKVKLSCSV